MTRPVLLRGGRLIDPSQRIDGRLDLLIVELADDHQLNIGDLRLRCLHVPGHCDDHLVLYEPAVGILITGDLLFVGKVGGTKTDAEIGRAHV